MFMHIYIYICVCVCVCVCMCVYVCVCVCVQEFDELDVRIICWKLTHNYVHDILKIRAAVFRKLTL